MRHRLAILISGGGTTMQEIIKASQSQELNIEIACVIASTDQAGGIEKAKKLGIPPKDILVIDPQSFKQENKINQKMFGEKIVEELQMRNVSVVTQNGWLPLTPKNVIDAFPNAIFNQHPGPVPEFGGKGMFGRRVHAAVLLFSRHTGREMWTEPIAQRVHYNFDEGDVIKSQRVEILPTDTVDDLQQRVLPIERKLQIQLLQDFISNKLEPVLVRPPIVLPGQELLLEEAKQAARLLYPLG